MPYEEYDRLAWGLVKEELRHLVKPRNPHGMEETLSQIIKPDKIGYYRAQGALSDTKHKMVRRKVLGEAEQRLKLFGHTTSRARMEVTGGKMDIESYFAWDLKELNLTDVKGAGAASRSENFLELRHLNFAVGKKKLILDVLNCFVLVNQHTLYRMVQRGAVAREPLGLLSDRVDDWMGYAAMFLLSHKYLGNHLGNTVFIPFCGGALLGQMAFTESCFTDQGWDRHKLRFFDSINKGKIDTSPFESALQDTFEGKEGNVTLQITTWIPDQYYHGEQEWAEAQIQKIAKNHSYLFNYCINTIYGRHTEETDTREEILEQYAEAFGLDIGKLFSDKRWATACQW